jgi:hypothetical protein
MIRIGRVTIFSDYIEAPIYEVGVIENGFLRMARFQFIGWKDAPGSLAVFERRD